MAEIITREEIFSRFESEWVFLEDPETTETLDVKKGRVLWHSKDRDEVYRRQESYDLDIQPFSIQAQFPKV